MYFTPDQQLLSLTIKGTQELVQQYNITTPKKLIDIVSLYEDIYGYIWIGTMGEGLFRLNPKTGVKQKITDYPSFSNASVLSIDRIGNDK